MNFKKNIFVACSFLIPMAGYAESLDISVFTRGTSDPVPEATVVIEATEQFDTTDGSGNLSFDNVSLPTRIKVLATGYETLTVELDRSPARLYLEAQSYESESLEVIAERNPDNTSKIILTREELARAPGSQGDPLKVIQSLPGVVTAFEGGGGIYLRGSEQASNTYWVNNSRVGYLFHGPGIQSTINPDLVKDFNIYPSNFSVEYLDFRGGALDVALRTPRNDRLHQFYSVGVYQTAFLLEGPIGKKGSRDSFALAGRRSYLDAVLDNDSAKNLFFPDEEESSDPDRQNAVTQVPWFYDVQAIWNRKLQNGTLSLEYFAAGDEIELKNFTQTETDPEASGTLAVDINYNSFSLNWDYNLTNQLTLLNVINYYHAYQSFEIGNNPLTNDPYYINATVYEYWYQPRLTWTPSDTQFWRAGAHVAYSEAPLDAFISRPPSENDPSFNLTEQEKYQVNTTYKGGFVAPYVRHRRDIGKFTADLGFRASYLRGRGGINLLGYSPRSTFEYRAHPRVTLVAGWGRYLQPPEQNEWAYDLGNPSLDWTESEHRLVGIRLNPLPLWEAKLELFHKPMYNLVIPVDQATAPDNFVNKGSGQARGLDLFIKRKLQNGKLAWLSYSYLDSERTNQLTGETYEFTGDQPHTLTAVYSQNLGRYWKIGLRFRASSGKPYTPVVGRTSICNDFGTIEDCNSQAAPPAPDPSCDPSVAECFYYWQADFGNTNSKRLPLFWQLDLRIDRTWLFNTWKLALFLDINNVTNHDNVLGINYGKNFKDIDNPQESLGLPLIPFFGLEANF